MFEERIGIILIGMHVSRENVLKHEPLELSSGNEKYIS